jgi:hypothetical protein
VHGIAATHTLLDLRDLVERERLRQLLLEQQLEHLALQLLRALLALALRLLELGAHVVDRLLQLGLAQPRLLRLAGPDPLLDLALLLVELALVVEFERAPVFLEPGALAPQHELLLLQLLDLAGFLREFLLELRARMGRKLLRLRPRLARDLVLDRLLACREGLFLQGEGLLLRQEPFQPRVAFLEHLLHLLELRCGVALLEFAHFAERGSVPVVALLDQLAERLDLAFGAKLTLLRLSLEPRLHRGRNPRAHIGKRRLARGLDRLERLLGEALLQGELVLALRAGHPCAWLEQQRVARVFSRHCHQILHRFLGCELRHTRSAGAGTQRRFAGPKRLVNGTRGENGSGRSVPGPRRPMGPPPPFSGAGSQAAGSPDEPLPPGALELRPSRVVAAPPLEAAYGSSNETALTYDKDTREWVSRHFPRDPHEPVR